jgi:hypothetical protein
VDFRVNLKRAGNSLQTLAAQAKNTKPAMLRSFGKGRADQNAAYKPEDNKQFIDEQQQKNDAEIHRLGKGIEKARAQGKDTSIKEKQLVKRKKERKQLFWSSRGSGMPKESFRPTKVTKNLLRIQVPLGLYNTPSFKKAWANTIRALPRIVLEHLMGIRH